jgi:hypothetical protein
VASFASDAEGVRGSLPAFHGRPSDESEDGQTAPNPSQPSSSRLEDLWRLNFLQDLPSNTRDLHKAGWRRPTEDRYDRAWQSFKGCSTVLAYSILYNSIQFVQYMLYCLIPRRIKLTHLY